MEIHTSEFSIKLVEKALREGFDEVAALVVKTDNVMAKIANSEPCSYSTLDNNIYQSLFNQR
jgi:hypothetical protein